MFRKFAGILILLVFAFGLIPGDYWRVLHHHKHYKAEHLHEGVKVTEKHKICHSETHLFDYTGIQEFYCRIQTEIVYLFIQNTEKHLPHPSFLNLYLRAPPGCLS